MHLAGFKYAGVSVDRPLHTYNQNVTGTVNLLEAMERTGVESMVFSSSAATFGTPATRPGHRGDPDPPRVAVRREQAHRRVADPRPGPGDRPAAHLAALLQRGRLRQRRPLRHQPAQPVPDRVRDAARREDAAHQRRRLRHPRRHLRARLRPRRRPGRGPRRGGAAPRRRRRARARLQPRQRHRLLGARDHGRHPHGRPASTSPPRSARAARATPTASWPPARSPPATSTGQIRHALEDMVRSAWEARSPPLRA